MRSDVVMSEMELTAYELDQVRRIAEWKSAAPRNPVFGFVRKVTRPGARLLERVIPARWVLGCIDQSYQVALKLAYEEREPEDEEAGRDGEAWWQSLETCDARAGRRCARANAVAVVQGAVTGVGGLVTTVGDIPLLLALAMQTVMRVGQCYGYSLEEQGDQRFVMGVLIAGSSGSLKIKRQRLSYLQLAEERVLGQTPEEMIAEEVFALLFHMELFEEIPGLGSLTAGMLNLGFMRKVGETARHVFQERWLRDRRGIGFIEPTGAVRWNGRPTLGTSLSRAASSTCYCLGFSVGLPASVMARALPQRNEMAH